MSISKIFATDLTVSNPLNGVEKESPATIGVRLFFPHLWGADKLIAVLI